MQRIRKVSSELERERVRLVRGRQTTSKFGTKREITNHINALSRGAVVLLSSHIEGYVKAHLENICSKIVSDDVATSDLGSNFKYYLVSDLVEEIRATTDPDGLRTKLSSMEFRSNLMNPGVRQGTSGVPIKPFLKGFSTPRPEKIYKLFKKFGFTSLKNELVVIMSGQFPIVEPSVDTLVVLRNDIAHGDITKNSTPSEIQLFCDHTKQYISSLDKVLCDWFLSRGCRLR